MNYERKQQLTQEFKISFHNKDFRPTYAPLGHKIEGKLTFNVFIFYAMLRNKNIEKTTHDVNSDKFTEAVSHFKSSLNKDSWYRNHMYNKVKHVFPSLFEEEFIEVISNYFS